VRKKSGKIVKEYQRGDGEPTVSIPTAKKLVGKRIGKSEDVKGHGGFEAKITYADDKRQTVIFKEKTYLGALPRAVGYADGQIRRITLRKMEPWSTEVKN